MDKKNYQSISEKYKKSFLGKLTKEELEAYRQARMPATYAAVSHCLAELKNRIDRKFLNLLDLGSGPGTGLLAAKNHFPELKKATLIEKDPQMIEMGKEIAGQGADIQWVNRDIRSGRFEPHDLVLMSYSLCEIPEKAHAELLKRAFEAARVLVIVEPGTPKGFAHIREARDVLVGAGGKILAPCPHHGKCPMEGGDWCHFSVRLERSKEHKKLKGAERGWEDEKFSYLIVSKGDGDRVWARILRTPIKRSGHVLLRLCAQDGLEEKIISRRDKEQYKRIRKAKWGDGLLSKYVVEESEDKSEEEPISKSPNPTDDSTDE